MTQLKLILTAIIAIGRIFALPALSQGKGKKPKAVVLAAVFAIGQVFALPAFAAGNDQEVARFIVERAICFHSQKEICMSSLGGSLGECTAVAQINCCGADLPSYTPDIYRSACRDLVEDLAK